jgi:8-oxo-dGTP pyrophosphatase MutT (NUDIX family)
MSSDAQVGRPRKRPRVTGKATAPNARQTEGGPAGTVIQIAAGAIRRGNTDAWLVQDRRVAAATGGTVSFFGGAREAQDSSMRAAMQRESREELVLIGKHGRPSRQPILYGAQIATVSLSGFEIHLFVAQIDQEADVHPSETEQAKTVAARWVPLTALLSPTDERLMPSTRVMAACIANIPPDMLFDLVRPAASTLEMLNPREWSRQPSMRPSRVTAASDRRTVSTYLHGYTTMTATAGPAIATYVAAEDALVAWMYRCRAGRMKMCDIWELLSFSAHQVQLHHEDVLATRLSASLIAAVNVPSEVGASQCQPKPSFYFRPISKCSSAAAPDARASCDGGTRQLSNEAGPASATNDADFIWYVTDFHADTGGMRVRLREHGWTTEQPGTEVCVFTTPQGQAQVSQPLEQICVGDSVKLISFSASNGHGPPTFAIRAARAMAGAAMETTAWT